MIGLCRPKLLWGYPVPACCHGNAVWDLNTSLCPLPVSLSSSSFHSSRLPSCFLSLSVLTLSRSISQSCFLWRCWGFSSSPCLVLSTKWHFTSCFLLLILCYFASHDSVKALVKYKVASPETQRRYLLYTHIITETFVDRCMYNYLQAHTNRSSHTVNYESQRSKYSLDAGTARTCWQSVASENLSFSAKASSSSII